MKKLLIVTLILSLMIGCLPAVAEAPVFNAYDEPVQVTILGTDEKDSATVFDSSNHDRAGVNENAWIDAYKEFLNVEVTRIVPEDGAARSAAINTMMASGDLPDIMLVDKSLFYVLAENGVAKDLTDVFNSYDGERWLAIKNSYTDDVWETGLYEGEMLGIPYCQNFYNNTAVMWIRTDWLDQVDMGVPTTLDELEKVALAFKEAGLGGDNTVGIGLSSRGWDSSFEALLAPFGVTAETWVERDGKMVWANTLPENKEALLWLQKIYSEGLIKSDFAVSDILNEEVANGITGLYFAPGWHGVTNINANVLNDENAVWTAARIPTLDGQPVPQTTNASVGNFIVVNKDYDHEDVFFRMKELEAFVYYESEPGDDFYYLRSVTDPDGSIFASWNLMVFRNSQRGDLDLYKTKLMCDAWDNGTPAADLPVLVSATYDKILNAVDTGDRTQIRLYYTYIEGYRIVNQILAEGNVVAGYNGPLTENMSLYQGTINDALTAAMVKVITGEDISVYENAVEEWYANGGQAITDEINAYYGK